MAEIEITDQTIHDYKQALANAGLYRLAEKAEKDDIINLAKLIKIYRENVEENNLTHLSAKDISLDIGCSIDDVNEMITFFTANSLSESITVHSSFGQDYNYPQSPVVRQGHIKYLAKIEDVYISTLGNIRLEDIASYENNVAPIMDLFADLHTHEFASVIPQSEEYNNVKNNYNFWRQYKEDRQLQSNSDEQSDPQDTICDIIIDRLYGTELAGKTVMQISESYPSKNGICYFEVLTENLHKHLDTIIEEAIEKDEASLDEEISYYSHTGKFISAINNDSFAKCIDDAIQETNIDISANEQLTDELQEPSEQEELATEQFDSSFIADNENEITDEEPVAAAMPTEQAEEEQSEQTLEPEHVEENDKQAVEIATQQEKSEANNATPVVQETGIVTERFERAFLTAMKNSGLTWFAENCSGTAGHVNIENMAKIWKLYNKKDAITAEELTLSDVKIDEVDVQNMILFYASRPVGRYADSDTSKEISYEERLKNIREIAKVEEKIMQAVADIPSEFIITNASKLKNSALQTMINGFSDIHNRTDALQTASPVNEVLEEKVKNVFALAEFNERIAPFAQSSVSEEDKAGLVNNRLENAFSTVMKNAGFTWLAENCSGAEGHTNIENMTKIWKLYKKEDAITVDDLSLENVEIDDIDIQNMILFYASRPVARFTSDNPPKEIPYANRLKNIREIAKVEEKVMQAVADTSFADIADNAVKLKDSSLTTMLNAFSAIHNRTDELESACPVNKYLDECVNNIYALAEYNEKSAAGVYSPAEELYGAMFYGMCRPLLDGKSNGQFVNMYHTKPSVDGYANVMGEETYREFNEFLENSHLTHEDVVRYKETGTLPDSIDPVSLQEKYDNAYLNIMAHYRKQPEYNMPAPILFDRKGVPDFEKASLRIAVDAMISLRKYSPDMPDKVIMNYGTIVETQVKKLLLKEGYVITSRQAAYPEDIEEDMEAFLNGARALPYNISADTVNMATEIALKGIRELYPDEGANLGMFSSELNYSKIKPELIKKDNDMMLGRENANINLVSPLTGDEAKQYSALSNKQLKKYTYGYELKEFDNEAQSNFAKADRERQLAEHRELEAAAIRQEEQTADYAGKISRRINRAEKKEALAEKCIMEAEEAERDAERFLAEATEFTGKAEKETRTGYFSARKVNFTNMALQQHIEKSEIAKQIKDDINLNKEQLKNELDSYENGLPVSEVKKAETLKNYEVYSYLSTEISNLKKDAIYDDSVIKTVVGTFDKLWQEANNDRKKLLAKAEELNVKATQSKQNASELRVKAQEALRDAEANRNSAEKYSQKLLKQKKKAEDYEKRALNHREKQSKYTKAAQKASQLYNNRRLGAEEKAAEDRRKKEEKLALLKIQKQREISDRLNNDKNAPKDEYKRQNLVFERMIKECPEIKLSDEEYIRALNLKDLQYGSMDAALRYYDKFIQCNQPLKCIDNSEVAKQYGEDATKLLYINGKPIDNYLKDDVKISGYSKYSPQLKEQMRKLAVSHAIVTGGNVDVKYYAKDRYGKCKVEVKSILYKGNEARINNEKWQEDALKRADKILKDNKRADKKIVDAINADFVNNKNSTHDLFRSKITEVRNADAQAARALEKQREDIPKHSYESQLYDYAKYISDLDLAILKTEKDNMTYVQPDRPAWLDYYPEFEKQHRIHIDPSEIGIERVKVERISPDPAKAEVTPEDPALNNSDPKLKK